MAILHPHYFSDGWRKHLKGHCHGDISVCWPKKLKYLTKNLFFNVKLLLEQGEKNMK